MSDYANNMVDRRKATDRTNEAAERAAAGFPSEQTVREALLTMTLDRVPAWADAVIKADRERDAAIAAQAAQPKDAA